jgi:hypothetical protein
MQETTIKWTQLGEKEAMDYFGNAFLNTPDSSASKYYKSYFYKALSLMRYVVKTGADKNVSTTKQNSTVELCFN